MTAYLQAPTLGSTVPAELQTLNPGFGRVAGLPDQPLVLVSEQNDTRLYLVFAQAEVSELVFYFGLAPLAAVLLTVYMLLFLSYRLSQQAISPMLNLARALEQFDFRSTDRLTIPVQPDDVDNETRLMVEALREFSQRLDQFIERERTFTRNAGHELRTPIAVIKGSLELLSQSETLNERENNAVARLQRVVGEMETVLEALLMLAREENVRSDTPVSVNQVIAEEIELLSELAEQQGNKVILNEDAEATCYARASVLTIIMGNLLRNAINFTDHGTVTVHITDDCVTVSDTGIGMSLDDAENAFTAFYRGAAAASTAPGQGLGLALVRRLTQQLEWRVAIDSELNKGTTFTVWMR